MSTRDRTWRWLALSARRLRTAAIALFLLGAVVAFGLVLAMRSPGQSTPAAIGNTPQWVTVPSGSPAAVAAAARQTHMYQEVAAAAKTELGKTLDNGALGTPMLVHAYRPTPGMTDVWVVPVLDHAGSQSVVALLDFAYDTANQRLRPLSFAGPFVAGDPEYGQAFPRYSASQAAERFASAHLAQPAPGSEPKLVYFPADLDKITGPHPAVHWTGGGQFADQAIWRIAGANGQDYFVGTDGNVYTASQLPLAANAGA
jgi:hypothetical protein